MSRTSIHPIHLLRPIPQTQIDRTDKEIDKPKSCKRDEDCDECQWSDQFNGLEVWNGFTIADANGDELRENKSLDRVMRDWFNMLSLGFYVTPAMLGSARETMLPQLIFRQIDELLAWGHASAMASHVIKPVCTTGKYSATRVNGRARAIKGLVKFSNAREV